MFSIIPEFMRDADNVYRTKNYIISQLLVIDRNLDNDNHIISQDTFYVRTRKRDKQYEAIFSDKPNINGKRLPCTMCTRKYVD